MNTRHIAWTCSLICLSSAVFALEKRDTATIVAVEEVMNERTVKTPYKDCWYETETTQNNTGTGDGSATNELIGAAIGGAIGNEMGGGSGKDAMTVIGALIGASIANDAEKQGRKDVQSITREVEKCRTHYRQEIVTELSHYRVQYDYKGTVGTYTVKHNPPIVGDRISVRVSIRPEFRTYNNRSNTTHRK